MRKTITTATLAALILRATAALAAPVCGDVNESSSVTSTDALLVLKKSVEQPVTLDCSPTPISSLRARHPCRAATRT